MGSSVLTRWVQNEQRRKKIRLTENSPTSSVLPHRAERKCLLSCAWSFKLFRAWYHFYFNHQAHHWPLSHSQWVRETNLCMGTTQMPSQQPSVEGTPWQTMKTHHCNCAMHGCAKQVLLMYSFTDTTIFLERRAYYAHVMITFPRASPSATKELLTKRLTWKHDMRKLKDIMVASNLITKAFAPPPH